MRRWSALTARGYPLRPTIAGSVACVAIGGSTGGKRALTSFLQALSREFDASILITQHLPRPSMPFFAEQLTSISHRPRKVALDGVPLRRGTIHVAQGDAHLICDRRGTEVVTLCRDAALSGRSLPLVDPMFASVARVFGNQAVGVVLSGKGRDGAEGAAQRVEAGSVLLVQDACSSVVWGMPGTVARAGPASLIADPAQLARHIARRGMRR